MEGISYPTLVILKDQDQDLNLPIENSTLIQSELDKIIGYGYGFRSIRFEPDPLTSLVEPMKEHAHPLGP